MSVGLGFSKYLHTVVKYSKALRCTTQRSADLTDTWFLIGSKNLKSSRIFEILKYFVRFAWIFYWILRRFYWLHARQFYNTRVVFISLPLYQPFNLHPDLRYWGLFQNYRKISRSGQTWVFFWISAANLKSLLMKSILFTATES